MTLLRELSAEREERSAGAGCLPADCAPPRVVPGAKAIDAQFEPGVACRFLVQREALDHPGVIAGQGTIGLDVLEDLQSVEVIVMGVGGGGLLSGVGLVVKAQRPAYASWVLNPKDRM